MTSLTSQFHSILSSHSTHSREQQAEASQGKHRQRYRLPDPTDHQRVSALFLGPKAENAGFLREYFNIFVDKQEEGRKEYKFDDDQEFLTSFITDSKTFLDTQNEIRTQFTALADRLNKQSIPFFSPRYSAHMCMDVTLPSILGYGYTMLYNPNNVAFEASPVTTALELEVGRQMSAMLGYNIDKDDTSRPVGWGHIACDGSVANLEAVWASRNLKFYPLSLRDAMKPGAQLDFIADTFQIQTCKGEDKLLKDLGIWELLNLPVQTTLDIPGRLYDQYGVSSEYLDNVMNNYIIQTLSKDELEKRWGITNTPQLVVPNTRHYSWPKATAIAGIGSANAISMPVDYNARMRIDDLKTYLQKCVDNEQAVYTVVAVMGTTEEGAVDRLDEILQLRDDFAAKGLSFLVHADAAWGGYFASMIREPPSGSRKGKSDSFVPHVGLRQDTATQLESLGRADSITIDPHKAGYIQYPAGGLCYRDGRMRYLVTWSAPYLHQDTSGESIGDYGVEGSKPGAAAAAVWLAHEVIGLHAEGHGTILGEASYSCRRFASHWAAMSDDKTDFIVVPLNLLPSELAPDTSPKKVAQEKQFIRDRILFKDNIDLVRDQEAMDLLNQLGSDLNINAFACNFRYRDGTLNTDIEEANYLNQRIFEKLSVTSTSENPLEIPFYLTSTTFSQREYGECATRLKERLGLDASDSKDLFVLRNVVMSPWSTTVGRTGEVEF
ncbi:PLP-dependent transferase [Dendrothele bispora CBS 962.96]|uniref:PLP-dependent transferase n=1 Tax=Dendrothele bispora (strain CBS 962.96) TaxID=1314807 RepID=A0A4S8MC39_DENBC|nr:PLP-dependent transferase [Dendrothele bispora CBS 962.96]